MNTSELVAKIAGAHGVSKAQAKSIVDDILKDIVDAAASGAEVSLPGFGKFKVKATPEREGRNPAMARRSRLRCQRSLAFTPRKSFARHLTRGPIGATLRERAGFDSPRSLLTAVWRDLSIPTFFNDPPFGQDDEAFDRCVGALDDCDGYSARLVGGPLRLVALVSAIDEGHCHPWALADEPRRAWAEARLDLGHLRVDTAFDQQSERIDGDMSLAPP